LNDMKLLITAPTFAPSMDGPVYLADNTFADADADTAHALVAAGKALYVDAKDDRTKRGDHPGMFTASAERVQLVSAALAAEKKAAKAAKSAGGDNEPPPAP
jgi:hypothetical protein